MITSTDFAAVSDYKTQDCDSTCWRRGIAFPDQNEEHVIKAVNGKTVTLETGLSFKHWGKDNEKAEVGYVSRWSRRVRRANNAVSLVFSRETLSSKEMTLLLTLCLAATL